MVSAPMRAGHGDDVVQSADGHAGGLARRGPGRRGDARGDDLQAARTRSRSQLRGELEDGAAAADDDDPLACTGPGARRRRSPLRATYRPSSGRPRRAPGRRRRRARGSGRASRRRRRSRRPRGAGTGPADPAVLVAAGAEDPLGVGADAPRAQRPGDDEARRPRPETRGSTRWRASAPTASDAPPPRALSTACRHDEVRVPARPRAGCGRHATQRLAEQLRAWRRSAAARADPGRSSTEVSAPCGHCTEPRCAWIDPQ